MKFTGEFFVPDEKFKKLSEDRELAIEHLQRYNSILSVVAGKDVLDIASGEGYGSYLLAQKANKVVGVDINSELIAYASGKYKKNNLSFQEGNVISIPLNDASVDVVVSFETLEHVSKENQVKFIQEAGRVLKKDGVLVISTPNKENYSDRFGFTNSFHVHELDEPSFAALLRQTFRQVELFSQGQEVVSLVFNKEKYEAKGSLQAAPVVKDHFRFQGKYLLAVCCKSEKKLSPDISNIVVEGNKSFFDFTERIVQLQNEVEELGAWGRKSVAEVDQLRNIVAERNKSLEDSERLFREKTDVIKQFEELMGLRDKMQQDSESIIRVKNDIIRQMEQLLVLRDKLYQDSETVNQEYKNKLVQLEEQLGEQRNLAEAVRKSNQELSRDKSQLEQDKIILEKDKETLRQELQQLEKNKSVIEQNLLQLENDKSELLQEKLNLDKELQESATTLHGAIQQINHLKTETESALKYSRHEKQKTEQQISDLSEKVSQAASDLEEKKNAIYRIETQKLQAEQKLQSIYESQGWKLLSFYYRIKGKLLPEHTKRYKLLKRLFGALKKRKKRTVETVVVKPVPQSYVEEIVAQEMSGAPLAFPVFDKVEVSIVIPAFNNWEFTRNCLISIYKFNDGIPFEVIVGDNVSTDETTRLPDYFTNIHYIRNKENLGYIKNVNNAASKARGKYILTLNNDTTVTEGWLVNLIKVMEADPKVGLVGSKLVYPDGSLQEAGGIIWKDASGWNYGRTSDPELPQFNYVKEVDYVSGASNLIRRDIWEKLNGLDLRYVPAYFDDSDLAFGIRKLGYKVMFQPLSVVVHYEGLTHGTSTTEGTKQYQVLNRKKFIQKWKDVLETGHFANAEKVFWARDRSRNKKTILVVDHYVPHFDKDAGSRTTYQLLSLFAEMNYNVKFIGDNFYKHEPYTTILQQMGIEVLHGPWYRDNWQNWVKENGEMIDFIYLNRPHISIKYIDFFRENTKAKIVYYGHDLHFIREQRQYEIEKTPQLLESMQEWRQVETYLIQKADTVLTLSCGEKEIMETELSAPNVKIMPAFFYNDFKAPIRSFSDRKDILFVGGFNHRPNVDAVRWFVSEVWPQVTAALKNTRFIIIGSLAPEEITSLESDTISVKGYVTDEELTETYNTIKMVIVPLRYGAGVKGKTVEAMSHGLPLVSTSFGIEGLTNIHTVLQPVDNAADFASRIISLYNNEKALIDLSEKEVNYAKTHFSKAVVKNLISETF
jgi:O-antigen biosynthesis protein